MTYLTVSKDTPVTQQLVARLQEFTGWNGLPCLVFHYAYSGQLQIDHARARLIIMAGQVAMACVLLVGAGLLLRSFVALSHADRGYDPANLLTARLPMPATNYSDTQRAALTPPLRLILFLPIR
jgi:predicted permease